MITIDDYIPNVDLRINGIDSFETQLRFLIHDSAREADHGDPHLPSLLRIRSRARMRLRQTRAILPIFVVTTTTPPPKALAIAPHAVATLSSKKPSGLLLRNYF